MGHLDHGAMVSNEGHRETPDSEDIDPLSGSIETGHDHNVWFRHPLQRDHPNFCLPGVVADTCPGPMAACTLRGDSP